MKRRKRCPKCNRLGERSRLEFPNGKKFDNYVHDFVIDTTTGIPFRTIRDYCVVRVEEKVSNEQEANNR